MTTKLRSMVHQISTVAPGTAAISLPATAASPGRRTFLDAFGTGSECYYYMEGASGYEEGFGTVTGTSTATLTRTTVLGNSFGTTDKINFTGVVNVWSGVPQARAALLNADGDEIVNADGDVFASAAVTAALATKADADDVTAALLNVGDNFIINGNFNVNQRGVSGTVVLAANTYGHDRWRAGNDGCTYTFATTGGVTLITITAGTLRQVVEGNNFEADTYCLSWIGTAQGHIDDGDYGDSGLTFDMGDVTSPNVNIEFGTGTLTGVTFSKGAVATPITRRPYGIELLLCQRYYETGRIFIQPGFVAASVGGTVPYKVAKRVTPTVSTTPSYSGSSGFSVLPASNADILAWNIATSAAGGFANVTFTADADF